MRKILLSITLLLAALPAGVQAAPSSQGSPGEVIAAINDFRAQNSLPAYQENSILMSIAQGQSDWIASQVTTSDIHAGPDGSRPRDRAFAAGYGGGQQIFISEIAKYGIGETPQSALEWWKQSPDHYPTLVASTYVEIGCGVSTDGNGRYYYVCVTGYMVGGEYTSSSSSSGSQNSQQPAAAVMIPVTKADPQPDGSVMHIIRTGQTLWTLAAVYEVPLQQLLELNNLPEWAVIFPGDEIMVMPAGSMPTVAPTEDPNATPTDEPEPTDALTPTPQPTSAQLAAADVSSSGGQPEQPAPVTLSAEAQAKAANTTVYIVVGVALVSIVGVFAASFFIQRPRPPAPPDNDPFAPLP
jgi:uncharacterized protein YkwD